MEQADLNGVASLLIDGIKAQNGAPVVRARLKGRRLENP